MATRCPVPSLLPACFQRANAGLSGQQMSLSTDRNEERGRLSGRCKSPLHPEEDFSLAKAQAPRERGVRSSPAPLRAPRMLALLLPRRGLMQLETNRCGCLG